MEASGDIPYHQRPLHRSRSVSLPVSRTFNPAAQPPSVPSNFPHFVPQGQLPLRNQHHVPFQQQPSGYGLPAQQMPQQQVPPQSWQQEEGQKRGYDPMYLRRQQQVAYLRQIFHRLSPQAQQQIRQQLLQWRHQKQMHNMYKRWRLQQQAHNMKMMQEHKLLQQQHLQQQQALHQQPTAALQVHHHQAMNRGVEPIVQQQQQQQQFPTSAAPTSAPELAQPSHAGLVDGGGSTDSPKQRRLSSFRRGRIAPIKKKSFRQQDASVAAPESSAVEAMDAQASFSPPAAPLSLAHSSPALTTHVPAPHQGNDQVSAGLGEAMQLRRTRSYSDPSATWPSQLSPQQLHQIRMQQHEQLVQLQHQQNQMVQHPRMQQPQQVTGMAPQRAPSPQQHTSNQLYSAQQMHHQPRGNAHPAYQHQQSPVPAFQQQQPISAQFPQQSQFRLPAMATNSEPILPTQSQRQESMELDLSAPCSSHSYPSIPPISGGTAAQALLCSGSAAPPQHPTADGAGAFSLGDIDALDMLDDQQFFKELSLLQEQSVEASAGLSEAELTTQASLVGATADFFEELGEIVSLPDDLFNAEHQMPMASEMAGVDQVAQVRRSMSGEEEACRTPDLSSFASPSLLPASPSLTSGFFQLHSA